MASKPKTPALDRLVRQAMRRAESLDGAWVVIYERKQLRELIRRVAAECARITDREDLPTTYAKSRREAAALIREQFRIEEGEDG